MQLILLTVGLAGALGAARAQGPSAAPGAGPPALVAQGDDTLAAWVEPARRRARLVLAWQRDGAWSPPVQVTRDADLGLQAPLLVVDAAGPLLGFEQGAERVLVRVRPDGSTVELGRLPAGPAALLAVSGQPTQVAWLEEAAPGASLRLAAVEPWLGGSQVLAEGVCPGAWPAAGGGVALLGWVGQDAAGARPVAAVRGSGGWQAAPIAEEAAPDCGVTGLSVARPPWGMAFAWRQLDAHGGVQLRLLLQGADGPVGPLLLHEGPAGDPVLAVHGDEVVATWTTGDGLHVERVDARGFAGGTSLAAGEGVAVLAQRDGLRLLWPTAAGLEARGVPWSALASPERPGRRVPPSGPELPWGYALPGLDGEVLDVSARRGAPILVNLWASWCPPCLVELPELKALHAQWAPRGLQVVGIAIDDRPERVRQRVEEHGVAWPVAFDESGRASRLFQTDELPTTLLYDAQGRRAWVHVGELRADDAELQAVLETLLPVEAGVGASQGPTRDSP